MNIILVSEGIRKGRTTSLSHRHILVIAVVGFILLPVLVGGLSYRISLILDENGESRRAALIRHQKQELQTQHQAIGELRRDAENHLNALAQRLGRLQAQVLRLNALGGRLTRMAGLDVREFNFSTLPAMGGPAAEIAPVQAGPMLLASLTQLDQQIETQTERLHALEALLMDHQLQQAVTPAGWPVQGGWVSSHFGIRADPFNGRRSMHKGVDIASPLGSPVKAMGDGMITFASPKSGYGLMVEVNHGQGYTTRYAHAKAVLVKVGERVTRGQPIAKVGTSGRSTGPHLHFEVLRAGRQVDPVSYLRQTTTQVSTTTTKRFRLTP